MSPTPAVSFHVRLDDPANVPLLLNCTWVLEPPGEAEGVVRNVLPVTLLLKMVFVVPDGIATVLPPPVKETVNAPVVAFVTTHIPPTPEGNWKVTLAAKVPDTARYSDWYCTVVSVTVPLRPVTLREVVPPNA